MLNNFIGGGQVFLHKVRMFWQVFIRTFHIALLCGAIAATSIHYTELKALDWTAFYSYRKAVLTGSFDRAMNDIRVSIGKKPNHITLVGAKTATGVWATRIDPKVVIKSHTFRKANNVGIELLVKIAIWAGLITLSIFTIIFLVWSRFGKNLKEDKTKDGENKVLTAKEVRRSLRQINRASDLMIGDMPLVKDMETMNLLVSGSIGSGKTNLIHNLLPQVLAKGEPAIIIDNTGEMIAKYYNAARGDIIFNPFDARSKKWDFWADCAQTKDLEKFADILIGFNSRKNNRGASDFWEESAQSIFVACASILQQLKQYSIEELCRVICQTENQAMYRMLQGTNVARYFTKDNAKTSASIISVLMANIKPLRFLKDSNSDSYINNKNNSNGSGNTNGNIDNKNNGNININSTDTDLFSISNYIDNVNSGSSSLLFLSTDPAARELTIPLNAALLELFISRMRRTIINPSNKIWVVMDELASLGKLPSLPQLMQEGRKYGACVLAGLQSTSQLYQHYGDADASNLIGLFKTKFAFASDDPRMGELYSKLCGTKVTVSQQKNTSFGANEFRDGVSYNERREKLPLVSYEEFGKLRIGECYVILPEISTRVAKIQVPQAIVPDKNPWFVEQNLDLAPAPVLRAEQQTSKEDRMEIATLPQEQQEDLSDVQPQKQAEEETAMTKELSQEGLLMFD